MTERIEDVPADQPRPTPPRPNPPMRDGIANLAAAFVKAQAEIAGAIKDSTNPHYKSKYADLSSVIDAIKPACAKNDLGFIQDVTEREGGVYVETVIVHKSGEIYRSGKLPMPAPKQDPHGYGSAISYGKRYSLLATFGVPSEDDDANKATAMQHYPSAVDGTIQTEGIQLEAAQMTRLARVASALTDLVDQEHDEKIDNEYKIWEIVEPIENNEEKLYLSALLGSKQSRVRSRLKEIGAKKRAENNPSGLKKIVTRGDEPEHPTRGKPA